jgi:hypothetical protein
VQLLGLVVLTVALLWLLRSFGRAAADLVSGFSELVGGWRAEPWPRGVQEEDRDRPWGRRQKARPTDPPPPQPTLSRVRPALHAR